MADDIRVDNASRTEGYDSLNILLKKGLIDAVKEHAESQSESINDFIIRAIEEAVHRDTIKDDDVVKSERETNKAISFCDLKHFDNSFSFDREELDRKGLKKPLPVGISEYISVCTEYYYVDKTMMIKDILDKKASVSLFTRPRRFGKTLNMDMLKTFFEKTESDTSIYFRDKDIWKQGEYYKQYQGKYPVIYLSFKDLKYDDWNLTLSELKSMIGWEFERHAELADSEKCSEYEKKCYKSFVDREADYHLLTESVKILCSMLHKHYDSKVVIIADEYDTPIHHGYMHGFYDEILSFMRLFLSKAFKDNPYLFSGFLTGILRVAKESIFSGLNNLTVYSVLDERFSKYFGFTKDEVFKMLSYYGYENRYEEICEWYDGYVFGDTEIFNPWSVVSYIDNKCKFGAYWVNTSSNDIIKQIISSADEDLKKDLYILLSGGTVTTEIDTYVVYPEIQSKSSVVYSFLLVCGYLKIKEEYILCNENIMYKVAIPNREVSIIYEKEILELFGSKSSLYGILQAITDRDEKKFEKMLDRFMLESISYFDGGNESFYHGMMLGLCAGMSNQYRIKSNRESEYGRFDLALFPVNPSNPGFVFEFKHTTDDNEDLKKLANDARKQIDDKKYDTEFKSLKIGNVIKTGIAFRGKKAEISR